MSNNLVAFFVGIVFAVGLGISGMTNPAKVLAFLDILGKWDPSLALVMFAAVVVNLVLFRFILKRPYPIYSKQFFVPTNKDWDARLLAGATIFGIGWGLAGFCPGPAIVNLVSGHREVYLFFIAMVAGAAVFQFFAKPIKT